MRCLEAAAENCSAATAGPRLCEPPNEFPDSGHHSERAEKEQEERRSMKTQIQPVANSPTRDDSRYENEGQLDGQRENAGQIAIAIQRWFRRTDSGFVGRIHGPSVAQGEARSFPSEGGPVNPGKPVGAGWRPVRMDEPARGESRATAMATRTNPLQTEKPCPMTDRAFPRRRRSRFEGAGIMRSNGL